MPGFFIFNSPQAAYRGKISGEEVVVVVMLSKRQILIVDDDQFIVHALMRAMMSKRHDVYEPLVAMDGYEALKTLQAHKIDCIILDLKMSNLNGLEVVYTIKTDPHFKDIEVIISSGFIDESMEAELHSFDIKHILKKPYSMNHLLEIVDALMLHPT